MEYLYCSCMFVFPNFFFHLLFDGKLKHQFYDWHFLWIQIFQNDRFFRWLWFSLYSYTLQLYKLHHIWSMEMIFVMQTSLNNVSWMSKYSSNLVDAKTHLTVQSIWVLVFYFRRLLKFLSGLQTLRRFETTVLFVEFLSWIDHLQEKYIYQVH